MWWAYGEDVEVVAEEVEDEGEEEDEAAAVQVVML